MISCLFDVKVSYTLKEQSHIYFMSTAMYELYKSEKHASTSLVLMTTGLTLK